MCAGAVTPLTAQEAQPEDPIAGLLRGNLDEPQAVGANDGGVNRAARPRVEAPDMLEPLDPGAPAIADAGDYNAETAPNVNANGPLPEEANVIGPLPDNDPAIVGAINNRPLGVEPPQRLLRRPPDEDAYAPMGVRAGSFVIRPTLDVGAGYNTNSAGNAGGGGASLGRVNGDVALESEWSRHAVNATVRGDYTYYKGNTDDNQLNLNGDVRGRVDITATTNAFVGLRGGLTSERQGDPNLPAGVVDRPQIANVGATVGGTWKPNRFGVTLEGLWDKRTYDDANLGGGVKVDNSDRNLNEYGLRLQTEYDVSDKFTPFVQVGLYKREHDVFLDRNGFGRDSAGASAAVGARYNLTDLVELNGSVGFQTQRYDDPRLPNLSGVLANGSVVWRPTALTTVTFNAATAFEETTIANSSGSVSHTGGVQVEHRLRRNLILTGGASFERANFEGVDRTDNTMRFDSGIEWLMNRSLALRANVAHERLHSSVAGEDYDATLVQLGVRLRR